MINYSLFFPFLFIRRTFLFWAPPVKFSNLFGLDLKAGSIVNKLESTSKVDSNKEPANSVGSTSKEASTLKSWRPSAKWTPINRDFPPHLCYPLLFGGWEYCSAYFARHSVVSAVSLFLTPIYQLAAASHEGTPALDGIMIGYELDRQLNKKKFFAESKMGDLESGKGFFLQEDEEVWVVENLIITHGSVKELVELIKNEGAVVKDIGALVNRGEEAEFGHDYTALIEVDVEQWETDSCSLCDTGKSIDKPSNNKFKM